MLPEAPVFKLQPTELTQPVPVLGNKREPVSGTDLMSQPTLSRRVPGEYVLASREKSPCETSESAPPLTRTQANGHAESGLLESTTRSAGQQSSNRCQHPCARCSADCRIPAAFPILTPPCSTASAPMKPDYGVKPRK
jgi:hypothetical protein